MADLFTDAAAGLYTLLNDDEVFAFTNVYARHDVAAITLPALTIGPERCEEEEEDFARLSGDDKILYAVTMSVRVHGNRVGGVRAQAVVAALADDVITKLLTNRDAAAASYRVMKAGVTDTHAGFIESETEGAQIEVVMHTQVNYTEET